MAADENSQAFRHEPSEERRMALGGGLAALATSVAKELAGDESPNGRPEGSIVKPPPRVLRVEVNGSLHDWFDVEEMGDFVRSPTFADTLLENIARYFHVPVESQAIFDEDGLLTTSADFSRALQRVAPMLYIYDVNEMGPELKERTVEELATINAGVEQTWKNFRTLGTRLSAATHQREAERIQSTSIRSDGCEDGEGNLSRAALTTDDALLSAKAMSPLGPRQPSSSSASQPAPSAPAKFGTIETETAQVDGQTDVQVYSLQAPTSTEPASTSNSAFSSLTLRLNGAKDVGGACGSQPNTGRTVFSAAQRNEELLTARTSTSSPLGTQVRKTLSPALSSQATLPVQPQQQVRPQPQQASDAPRSQNVTRSPVQPVPTRSTAQSSATNVLLGNQQSVRWQSAGLLSATAPVQHSGYQLQGGSRDEQHLARMASGTVAGSLERPLSPTRSRPLSPTRSLTPTAAARSLTPPPQTTQAYSLEARSVTPTPQATQALGLESRYGRPPPVSPAQVGTRNTSLVRMGSNSHLPYTSVRSMERSLSPSRATTPTPISARSVTPTPATQQQHRGADVHAQLLRQARTSTGPLRTTMPAVGAANRGSTPVRSVTHPSYVGGTQFSTQPVNQPGLGRSALQQGRASSLGTAS